MRALLQGHGWGLGFVDVRLVLVDTPIAPYFSKNLTHEDLDDLNIEVGRAAMKGFWARRDCIASCIRVVGRGSWRPYSAQTSHTKIWMR